MNAFPDSRSAIDFIVGKIVSEAQREGSPLSELEEKIMYFSETNWTLPDMAEISTRFDEQYEQSAYEDKISNIIRRYIDRVRSQNESEFSEWLEAISAISNEDRYLLVLTGLATDEFRPLHEKPFNYLWVIPISLAVAFAIIAIRIVIQVIQGSM